MSKQEHLLSDEQMSAYVRDGYVTVQADYPEAFHASNFQQIEAVLETEGNPKGNIMSRVPALQDIVDHPRVVGALTSILGPEYYLHSVGGHCHFNEPGNRSHERGQLHRDGFLFLQHRTRWMILMYYPQDVTADMGPTSIAPGVHYNNAAPDVDIEVPMCGPAGTVVIVHYDVWHRGMPNRSDKNRYMIKFHVARMEEPDSPDWNAEDGAWSGTDDSRDGMWSAMWRWHGGGNGAPRPTSAAGLDLDVLMMALRGRSEPQALHAAYELPLLGAEALGPLMATLREGARPLVEDIPRLAGVEGIFSASKNATYALSAMGAPAVSALVEAARDSDEAVREIAVEVLGEMGRQGRDAEPALVEALRDDSAPVRRKAADALGTVDDTPSAVPALIDGLGDTDLHVRGRSALALARRGPAAEEAVPALANALGDRRYVHEKAVQALRRVGTAPATDALLKFLVAAKWDSLTRKR